MITKLYDSIPQKKDGKMTYAEHMEFVCSPEDIANLPGAEKCAPGSIAWVVSTGKFYGFDGTNWVEQ